MKKEIFECLKLIENNYIYNVSDEEWMKCIVNDAKDLYLNVYSSDEIPMDIFRLLGIKVRIIENGMFEIVDFLDKRKRILHVGDVILSIDGKNPREWKKNNDKSIIVMAIRDYKRYDASVIIEEYSFPKVSKQRTDSSMKIIENDRIVYINFLSFDDSIIEMIDFFYNCKENEKRKLILDLRNNMGGALKYANLLLNALIEKGNTAYIVKDKFNKMKKYVIKDGRKCIFENTCILVNKLTSSCAEIVTAALADCNNGIIIGEKTFGKGVILKNYRLGKEFSVVIPQYEYMSSKCKRIHNIGLEPHIRMTDNEIDMVIENNIV